MSTPELESPIEARLRRALLGTAGASVPDSAAVPLLRLPAAPHRLRRHPQWALPLVAAACVAALIAGSAVGVHLADRRSGGSAAPASTDTTSITTPAATPSAPASRASTDWFDSVDVPSFHPMCSTRAGMVLSSFSVTVEGEPLPLGLAAIGCDTNVTPSIVEVYRYSPAGPSLIQTVQFRDNVPTPGLCCNYADSGHTASVSAAVGGFDQFVLGFVNVGPYSDPSLVPTIPDAYWRTPYRWSAANGRFESGPPVDAVQSCTAAQLTNTASTASTQSGDGLSLVIVYANSGEIPCTLEGIPHATLVDRQGTRIADAAPFVAGSSGGDPTWPRTSDRVTVTRASPASAVVHWTCCAYQPGDQCYSGTAVDVVAPGTDETTRFALTSGQQCSPQITAIVPGTTGMTS